MATISVIWDPDEAADGNVQHIVEHDLTKEEVEEVLDNHYADYFISREKPHNPITFGQTSTGRYIGVVFEIIDSEEPRVRPITAFDAPPPAKPKRGKRRS